MNEFDQSILKILSLSPGIKASEIAKKLNCEKKLVNSALYYRLKDKCRQDSSYRWYLNTPAKAEPVVKPAPQPDKTLSDLCKYYLNCLSLEENNGISAFLTSKYSLDYAELDKLFVDSSNEQTSRLIRRVSAEKNLSAHVGYPVLIEALHSTKTNQDYYKIAPVFLFAVEISGGAVSVSQVPRVNMEAVKMYSSRDINSQVYDLIELENELGLNIPDAEIDLDELTARLQAIRQWPWKEHLDPAAIRCYPPVSTITQEGIYNRAIFIVSERPPYTIGLESELSQLAEMSESAYRGTALYDWIHPAAAAAAKVPADDTPLLEILPMNSEQEQAVRSAFVRPLTVVTGPPGTGKSQVVTNLLANAAWNGKSVLFTSKNNKAVDVVENRINSLSRRPIMLRIGGDQYACRLAELISDLLSSFADAGDLNDYQHYYSLYQNQLAACRKMKEQKAESVNLRNHVDHMEQKVCDLWDCWEKWFRTISAAEIGRCGEMLDRYDAAYHTWSRAKSSVWGRLFWFAVGKNKTAELAERLADLNQCFGKYELPVPAETVEQLTQKRHEEIRALGRQMLDAFTDILEYSESLEDLLAAPKMEDLDREWVRIQSALADIAGKLWDKWLFSRPLQIDAASRAEMNEFLACMNLVKGADLSQFPDIRKKFNHLQKKMTAYLPCQAVTSLSAKGRVAFEPGLFDYVVIDEASQCDIAPVLPMLYRAKRAVIIGDPKQLSHISTISNAQDLGLLQRFGVNVGWSYTANSLYALAASLSDVSQIIQLKDHHRSCAEIIEYSNAEFYSGKLRVATNYDSLKCPGSLRPGIRWVNVVGKTVRPTSGGAYNDAEAAAIVKEIQRLVIENDYHGSVGVVTPFRTQAERIRAVIAGMPDLQSALLRNDLLADTVHKFQGDERDLMFFSPVISDGTGQNALNFLRNTGNLFNVAVTRARAVLVVVGDSETCAHCGIPYLEHFVEHIHTVQTGRADMNAGHETAPSDRAYPQVANPEQVSDWERLFYAALYDEGIRTIPQYPADKYKLDLAILKGDRKLDIEIDGEMYHKDWNGELSYRDQLRNQRLFELGWDVKRFWVYQIRDDLDGCLAQVRQWIEK